MTPRRVLIMDDEPVLRELLVEMIRILGHDADAVPDGRAAVELYKQALAAEQPFHLVILDLTVRNGLGGKETILLLREADPAIKAIATSGYSTDAVMTDFQLHGFVGRLSKPYKLEELQRVLTA